MHTLPKRQTRMRPDRDYPVDCAYCGVPHLRPEMKKDMQGLMVCPDEGKGRSVMALDRIVAATPTTRRRTSLRTQRDGTFVEPPVITPPPFPGDPYKNWP